MQVEYDSNGNRKKLVKSTQSKVKNFLLYDVNKLNQYESIGDLKLKYDKNGDLANITNVSSTEHYFYYPDGKLYRYFDVNDDCRYKYDCLERVNQITCLNSGVFQIGYHSTSQFHELFYVKLPNESAIYFTQIPSIGINGLILEGQFYLIERNENFQIVNLISKNHIQTEFLKYLDPFESVDTSFPFDMNSFKFKINKKMLLSENNKPSFSNSIGRELGIKYDAPLSLNFYESKSKERHPLEFFVSDGFKSNLNKRILDVNSLKLPDMTSELLLTEICTDLNDASVNFEKRIVIKSNVDPIQAWNRSRTDRYQPNTRIASDVCSALAQAGYEYFVNGKNAATVGKEVLTDLLITPEFGAVSNAIQTGDYFGSLSDYMADKLSDGGVNELAVHFMSAPFLKNPAIQCSLGVAKYFLSKFFGPLFNSALIISTPKDPNEMTGPLGYGPENFIMHHQEFITFSIFFENIENATGPAQIVLLDSYLSELFDLRSIEFVSFGFNEFSKELIGLDLSYINQMVDWENERMSVRFQAFVDPVSRRLKCVFKTIDKNTGEVPQDASLGFLPPKNGPNGQGFFRFNIKLSKTIEHFNYVQINSTITFDNEEPIVTNNLFYTIDKEFPMLEIEWNKEDEYLFLNASDRGSGVKQVLIYDKAQILFETNEQLFKLALDTNKEYEFFYTVEDYVGNILDKIYFGNINTLKVKVCVNNCSSNGVCNATYGVCECFQNYVGDDCSKPIAETDQTLTQLLSNLNVQLEFRKSLTRNVYDFELSILTENISTLNLIDLPKEILFVNNIKPEWSFVNESANKTIEFQLEIPFNYSNAFVLQLLIAFKNHNLTTRLNYDVYLESYLNLPEINLNFDCYDREKDKNLIELMFPSLTEQDTVEIGLIKFDAFLSLSIGDYSNVSKTISIEVMSSESSFETNIYVEISINKNYKEAYNLSQVLSFESCLLNEIESTESISTLDNSLTDQVSPIASTTNTEIIETSLIDHASTIDVASASSQSETSSTDNQVSLTDSTTTIPTVTSVMMFDTSSLNILESTIEQDPSETHLDTTSNFPDFSSSTISHEEMTYVTTEIQLTSETKPSTLSDSSTTSELIIEQEGSRLYIYLIIGGSVLVLISLASILLKCFKKKSKKRRMDPVENIRLRNLE